jgi:hypothetical protein
MGLKIHPACERNYGTTEARTANVRKLTTSTPHSLNHLFPDIYFPAHASPSALGPASIIFSTVQSDVRMTAIFLLASQET